jgi:glycosyltransferase involved in cell wall biosynthesis
MAIDDHLDDTEQALELGENARARCLERYSFERVGEQLSRVVRTVSDG